MAMQYDVWSVKIRSSTNFYVTSVTPSGSGALTLANTTPGINGYGYKVTVRAASTDESGVNFTITGTTVGGVVVTEVIAGPDGSGGAATTSTTNYFASVSSITTSAGTTGAITVGYSGNLALPMTRVKGLYYLASGSAGSIIVTRNSDSQILLEIDTPALATQVNSLYMAAEGIRTTYQTNDFATVAATNVTATTLICG
jgi:hypothetical protein